MTGRRLPRLRETFEAGQEELDWVYREHVAISQNGTDRSVPAVPVPVPEEKLAELLKNPKAATIFRGEQNGQYPSQSEADLVLATVAVRARLTEGECRAVIEKARQNAKAEPKHENYYRLTIPKARGDHAQRPWRPRGRCSHGGSACPTPRS